MNCQPLDPPAFGVRGDCGCHCACRLRFRWHAARSTVGTCSRSPIACWPTSSRRTWPRSPPILVRIFKEESELEVWKEDRTGRFALLKTYPICRWSGDLGPKIKEGDRQAPEGFYTITPGLMNPNSSYYLAINTGFPNAYRPLPRAHRRLPDDPRRLLLARLLRHDRRADRRNLFARARVVLRRPEGVPDPGLSVPHDARQHGAPPQFAAHGVLAHARSRATITSRSPGTSRRSMSANGVMCSMPNRRQVQRRRPLPGLPGARADRHAGAREAAPDDIQTAELINRGTPVAASRAGVDGGMNRVFLAALSKKSDFIDSEGRIAAFNPRRRFRARSRPTSTRRARSPTPPRRAAPGASPHSNPSRLPRRKRAGGFGRPDPIVRRVLRQPVLISVRARKSRRARRPAESAKPKANRQARAAARQTDPDRDRFGRPHAGEAAGRTAAGEHQVCERGRHPPAAGAARQELRCASKPVAKRFAAQRRRPDRAGERLRQPLRRLALRSTHS